MKRQVFIKNIFISYFQYLLPFALILIWIASYPFTCASILIPLATIAILFNLERKYRIYKRKCFLSCFIKENFWLYEVLTGKYTNFIISIFYTVFFVGIVFISVIFLKWYEILILGIDILFLVYIYKKFSLHPIKENVKLILTINFLAFINGVILLLLFLILNLLSPLPSLVDNSFTITIDNFNITYGSSCNILNAILQIPIYFYAAEYWLFAKEFIHLENMYLKLLISILFLGGNFLFFYSYGKYILMLVEKINELTNGQN